MLINAVRKSLGLIAVLGMFAAPMHMRAQTRRAAETAGIAFKKMILDREFRSEGVAVADVNRDGQQDVLAGNFWYEAPNWRVHEIATPEKFNAAEGWSTSFLNFAADVNGDGWTDQIVFGFPGKIVSWRENPKGRTGHWAEHAIARNMGNESPAHADLLGTGRPVFVFGRDESQMAWFEPGKTPTDEFAYHDISEPKAPGTEKFSHGLGVGDVNGDGRADVLVTKGYWEAPANAQRAQPWKFVAVDLGPDCAQMFVSDINADGLPDVVSSSAHNIGVWWFEQQRAAGGASRFVRHVIDDTFSQAHGMAMADMNGDGVMDFVTGKRFWAHGPNGDVRANDPAVIYWFEPRRGGKQVRWVRHEVDNDSGVGLQVIVADMNNDRLPDVVSANKKGVFVLLQTGPGQSSRADKKQ